MTMTRNEVTELVIIQKLYKKITWGELANAIGLSKEWTTAALLGQMTLTSEQVAIIQLQVVPYKGSLPTAILTDHLFTAFMN